MNICAGATNQEPDFSESEEEQISTKSLLLEICKDVKTMNKKFDKLDQSVKELKLEKKRLNEENIKLIKKVDSLTTALTTVEESLASTVKQQEKT